VQTKTEAIVCSLRTHGEHGAVVRMLTPDLGLVAAYVRGGRGRRMRPVLIPGNLVSVQLRSRTEAQLPQATVELSRSRAGLLNEPLAAAAIEWATALVTAALPERQPYPRVYDGFSGLMEAIAVAPSAKGWSAGLATFERILLAELGYGQIESASRGTQKEGWPDLLAALNLSGDRLFRDALTERSDSLRDSRQRLLSRLRRLAH